MSGKSTASLRCSRSSIPLPSEVRVSDRLEKLEKHTHKLSDLTDYLLTAKYTKAQDHAEEVAEFFATLDECATAIFRVIHERQLPLHRWPSQLCRLRLLLGRPLSPRPS